MAEFDADFLARRLEARFGIGLSGVSQEVDGGTFMGIRPDDLERPNGFTVIIARTPKIVEASLRLDNFTRSLLREMSEADEDQRSTFHLLASKAKVDGYRVNVSVNENLIDVLTELPNDEWNKFEVDCDRRLSGQKVTNDELNEYGLEVASLCLGLVLSMLPVAEVTESVSGFEPGLPEGAKIRVEVNRYERSPVNRAACISHFGAYCQVCGFDFHKRYGPLGRDYIEVHHRIPVSEMGGSYRLDPINDLIPLCGNCHAMIHRENPPLEPDQLRDLIES
jgi:5-methylcytosine-specific restriction enzyme A